MILVWGKARSYRAPNLGCRGAESPELFDISREKLCTSCDTWTVALSRWSCQSPVAYSCSLLNHLNSFCGGMFKLNAKWDADSLLYLLSHFECNSHTVHMLTQQHLLPPLTSRYCSCMHIPIHSPWLPGYINVVQTVLAMSTIAGLFMDRPCISHSTTMSKLWQVLQ